MSSIKNAEKTKENGDEGKWIEQFPAKNPNPVIRVKTDGTVLYANRAATPLLKSWDVEVGGKLPKTLKSLVRKVSGREKDEELELKVGGRVYLLTFYYEPGEEAINIYSFDISSRVQREKETKKKHLRLEKALWNNLQIMETMVDTIPAPVYYKDREGKYMGCNRLFADQIIGLPEEKIKGFKLTELETIISPATAREYQQLDMELLRKGGKQVYETVIPYLNGEEREIHVSRAVYRDETENFAILVGVLLDISELKKVEKALRDNLQFQETLLDAIPIPVFYKDMRGIYLGCNELFASRILGLPKENIVGHSMREFEDRVPREFADLYEKYDLKLLRENESQYYEAKVRCAKKGEIRDFLITKALYFDTAGKRAGIVGIMQDITERKKGEEILQKSEERYQLAAEQTGQIIYDYDIQADRDDWAGAIEKLTGYSFEEFQKFNIEGWASHIHPEDRKRAVKAHYDSFETDTPYHEEYRFMRKDGSYFYAEDRGIFLKDRSSRIYRMLGVIKDITERKAAEEALEKTGKIRKREIHHRIKNNLQVISSLLELQAEKFDDEEVLEAFRESQNRVASMAIIHEELYGSKDKDMLTLDFSAYLRKLTADLLNSYTLKSDNIRLELEVEEIFIGIDTAVPLGIIINELVSNSLKHAFTPEKPGEIRISFLRTENYENGRKNSKNSDNGNGDNAENEGQNGLSLIVSDSGEGFPEEIDFRNTDSLGLQLVNTLVDQIGGTIELKKGRGTEFSIRFREPEK
ncbi:MAG: PAS domain S-box protein [Methanosarcinaceae archaeon]